MTGYLKVWLCKAPSHGDHGGGERPGDADGGEELGDVGRQAEWNRTIGVQLSGGVVDVEAEVRDVELPCVLERIKVNIKSPIKKTALIWGRRGVTKQAQAWKNAAVIDLTAPDTVTHQTISSGTSIIPSSALLSSLLLLPTDLNIYSQVSSISLHLWARGMLHKQGKISSLI